MKVAILDDYQNVALRLADWSAVRRHAEITVFNDHVADPSAVVEPIYELVGCVRGGGQAKIVGTIELPFY
jgi:hypothetical protein